MCKIYCRKDIVLLLLCFIVVSCSTKKSSRVSSSIGLENNETFSHSEKGSVKSKRWLKAAETEEIEKQNGLYSEKTKLRFTYKGISALVCDDENNSIEYSLDETIKYLQVHDSHSEDGCFVSEDCYSEKEEYTVFHSYDSQRNILISNRYGKEKKLIEQYLYEYSSVGLLLNEIGYDHINGKVMFWKVYRYDCKGNNTIIETDRSGDGLFDVRTVLEYDNAGRLSKKGGDEHRDGILSSSYRYKYKANTSVIVTEMNSEYLESGLKKICELDGTNNTVLYTYKNSNTQQIFHKESIHFDRKNRIVAKYVRSDKDNVKLRFNYTYKENAVYIDEVFPVHSRYVKYYDKNNNIIKMVNKSPKGRKIFSQDTASELCWKKIPTFAQNVIKKPLELNHFDWDPFVSQCVCFLLENYCQSQG